MSEQTNEQARKYDDIFAELAAPFAPEVVRMRNQGGRQFSYITARVVMNRLDDVVGPANWSEEYLPGEHGVVCRLTITLPDGKSVTKVDAGGYAGMADQGDDEKSGYSDAFKRAAAKFGIGRYLYGDGIPLYVMSNLGLHDLGEFAPRGGNGGGGGGYQRNGNGNGGGGYQNSAPRQQSAPPPQRNGNGNGGGNGNGRPQFDPSQPPRNGRGMWAWCKEKQEKTKHDWVRDVNEIGKQLGLPARMVDWTPDDIAAAWPVITGSQGGSPQPATIGRDYDGQDDDSTPF